MADDGRIRGGAGRGAGRASMSRALRASHDTGRTDRLRRSIARAEARGGAQRIRRGESPRGRSRNGPRRVCRSACGHAGRTLVAERAAAGGPAPPILILTLTPLGSPTRAPAPAGGTAD